MSTDSIQDSCPAPVELRASSPRPSPYLLSPGEYGVGIGSFLTTLGYELPLSLLAALFIQFKTPILLVTIIEGGAIALAIFASMLGTHLATTPRRRLLTILLGHCATTCCYSLLGLATTTAQLALFRISAATSRGLYTPAFKAFLADLGPSFTFRRTYGLVRLLEHMGNIAAPLLALALVFWLQSGAAFVISLLLGGLALGFQLLTFFLRRRSTIREQPPTSLQALSLLQRSVGLVLAALGLFSVCQVTTTLLLLRTIQMLPEQLSSTTIVLVSLLLYAVFNMVTSINGFFSAWLSERWGPVTLLSLGLLLYLLSYLGFAFSLAHPAWLMLCFTLAGMGNGCIQACQKAAIVALSPAELRLSALRLLPVFQACGSAIAGIMVGLLWTFFSPMIAFIHLAVWTLLAFLILVTVALSVQRQSFDSLP
ncbi:putative MFS family arabinose efflux permease [Thermosporothrix hazakensis]|uniref:Putative MFS family arabinose efflux permease n=1 Tax=Thermosporothrix hazakensis TaxID=644383 RepID=A0A326TT65_THEHA|nr:MFS transporter [Thermosporothrix hazakensis]PZW19712.1 putative MFS family arabinose efflux permease [Thermosporothrix hazakensis]GCE48582.1 MFS transporter [Thermosporothrix hazakensis]